MSDSDTRYLLERAVAGNESAVRELLRSHRSRLCKMVQIRMDRRMIGRLDASDIVQESLATAYQRLPGYLKERQIEFYPWLRNIAWNRLIDAYRRHVHAERRSVDREAAPKMELSDQSGGHLVERLVDQQQLSRVRRLELRARLLDALDHLSQDHREVLMLRFLEQMSVRLAAQTMHISEAAVQTRQVRALQAVRVVLESAKENDDDV